MSLDQVKQLLDLAVTATGRERVVLLANAAEGLRALPQDDPDVIQTRQRRAGLVLRTTDHRTEESRSAASLPNPAGKVA